MQCIGGATSLSEIWHEHEYTWKNIVVCCCSTWWLTALGMIWVKTQFQFSDGSSVIKVLPSSEMLLSLKKDPKKSFKLSMNDECESISSESWLLSRKWDDVNLRWAWFAKQIVDPQNGSTMQIVYPKIAKLQNALHLCFDNYMWLMEEFIGGQGWGKVICKQFVCFAICLFVCFFVAFYTVVH